MHAFYNKYDASKRIVRLPQGGRTRLASVRSAFCTSFLLMSATAAYAEPPTLASDLTISQSAINIRPYDGQKTAPDRLSAGNVSLAEAEPAPFPTDALPSDASAPASLPPTGPSELAATTPQTLTGPAPGPPASAVSGSASALADPARRPRPRPRMRWSTSSTSWFPNMSSPRLRVINSSAKPATRRPASISNSWRHVRRCRRQIPPASPDSDFPPPTQSVSAVGGSSDDEVQVSYVPDVVKNQIRDEGRGGSREAGAGGKTPAAG